MSTNSNIEWTDNSWSPITGCTRVSAGCDHCYSARMTYRLEKMGQQKYTGLTVLNPAGDRHFNGVVKCHEDQLMIPFDWKKPRRIFVNSMSDTFHKNVPIEFIARLFAIMGLASWHTFQVLTKRIERAREILNSESFAEMVADASSEFSEFADDAAQRFGYVDVHERMTTDWRAQAHDELPLSNVWLGTSVEDQSHADERILELLKCPAAARFLSVEPLLGPVDLTRIPEGGSIEHANGDSKPCFFNSLMVNPFRSPSRYGDGGIHWVIVGGESGPGARPMHPDWARTIRDQCVAAGVPFFFKQWGVWAPFKDNVDRHYPDGRPGFGGGNREYNRALKKMIRAHGGTRLLDDRPEGWQPYMIEDGMGINGGSEDQEFLLNVGKKRAGRLLDEMEWNEMPAPAGASR